jgi:hypothetical protein
MPNFTPPSPREEVLKMGFNDNCYRSNYTVWQSSHSFVSLLSVSEAELLYRDRSNVAVARVQV